MKKTVFILLIGLFLTTSIFAQKRGSTINWLSIAVKGGYGGSLLMNKDVFADKNVTVNYMNGSYFVGGRFGWTFGDYVGLSFEVDYSSFGQEYDVTGTNENFNKKTSIKSLDLIPMFRFTGSTGFYAEIGPKFSTLKSIDETPTLDISLYPGGLTNIYEEKYLSAILGLGFMPLILDRITLSIGVRANYGWKSLIASNTYYTVTDDRRYSPSTPYTDATINLIQLQGVVEFNYFFGFFGDATCGRGRLMLFQ
jgi:hypothetical protein